MENLHDQVVCGVDLHRINSPAFYDCCAHCVCTSGSASFKYFDNAFTLQAGQMAVMSYPKHIADIATSPDFACTYVVAPSPFLHGLLPANNYSLPGSISLTQNPIMDLNDTDRQRITEDFRVIASRLDHSDHLFYREMLGSLLRTMIYDIFDIHARRDSMLSQTSRVSYVVTHFVGLVQAGEPTTHREPAWYASKLNITVKYLGDTVRRTTGTSPSDHINRAAAATLRDYIEHTDLSLTQIAEQMNFSSLSYLNRFCRRHLGAAPSQLRRVSLRRTSDAPTSCKDED